MLVIIFSIILVLGLIIAGTCYGRLLSIYKKYSTHEAEIGRTSFDIVCRLIDVEKLNTKIALIDEHLADAYLVKRDVIVLSKGVANGSSVADISVACHEFGHAMQKNTKSKLLKFDNFLQVFSGIANFLLPISLISALVLCFFKEYQFVAEIIFFISVGLWFSTLLFKLFLIPLEYDASKRAYNILKEYQVLNKKELRMTKKILNAAALTYVGSLFVGVYKIFYFIKKLFRRD